MDKVNSIITNLEQANRESERAYWWLKEINADSAKELGVLSKVKDVMSLLRTVDKITTDVVITIKQNSK